MNLSEFHYLADHLHAEECRKLVAALHFDSFETPNALGQAEKKISPDVPCLEQLLHWNSEKGGGKRQTHEIVARRLTQIGREDLSKWLSTKSYEALGHDFERMARDAFRLYEPIRLPTVNLTSPIKNVKSQPVHFQFTTRKNLGAAMAAPAALVTTTTASRRIIKQESQPHPPPSDPVVDATDWTIFDTISWTIVILLFLIIVVLMVYLSLALPCCRKKKKRKRSNYFDEEDSFFQTSSPTGRMLTDSQCPCSEYSTRYMSECPYSKKKHCYCMQSDPPPTPKSSKARQLGKSTKGKSCLMRSPSSKNLRNQQSDEDDFCDNQRLRRQGSVQTVRGEAPHKPRPAHNFPPNSRNHHHPHSSKSVHLLESSIGSDGMRKGPNRAALELMGVEMPRGQNRKRTHPHMAGAVAQAFRTIDIHQKIAIPMNSNAGT